MAQLKIPMVLSDADRVNAVLQYAVANGVRLPVSQLGVQPGYRISHHTYPFASSAPWAPASGVSLAYGALPGGSNLNLRLWQVPESLVNLPKPPPAVLPCFSVMVGTTNEATGATETALAPYYSWATQVGVTVKRLPALSGVPTAATTYELVGVSEYDIVLLERLLTTIGVSHSDAFIAGLSLLFAASPSGDTRLGWQSDDPGKVTAFISQVNLTTVTRPPTLARPPGAVLPGTAQKAGDFLRLLWQCSITRSGGFYLYYCSDPVANTGLPDRLFNDRGEATLNLLILYNRPPRALDQNRVAGCMNALATGTFIDPGKATVFAQGLPLPNVHTATPNDQLSGLAATYRMSVAELAEANIGVLLGTGLPLLVRGGSYQVRPSAPGGDPQAIAAWFGTSVAALQAQNPGLDLYHELALWAMVRLPDLTLTTGGSPSTGCLADVAADYGTAVATVAADNSSTQGIFAGRALQVAWLYSPESGESLVSLAAQFYMDATQLAEDNAAVAMVPDAQVAVQGGVYEVPAAPGANTLAAIASRFAMEPQSIRDQNPNLDWNKDHQDPWTLVRLPNVTITAGSNPAGASLGRVAAFYGVNLGDLTAANQNAADRFRQVPLRVRGGPLLRQVTAPPGTVTYSLQRTAPGAVPVGGAPPDPSQLFLDKLYSLLSYQVPDGQPGFSPSYPGPSLGPVAPQSGPAAGDKMRQPRGSTVWTYQKAIPYSTLALNPPPPQLGLPDPKQSPYLGVGGTLQVEFAWLDLYGNRGFTPLSFPGLDPAAPLNEPPAAARYTDPLLSLGQWPSLGVQYSVLSEGGQSKLRLLFTFDTSHYYADPNKSGDPLQRAQHDLNVYGRIWYQLTRAVGGGVDWRLETSLLTQRSVALDGGVMQQMTAGLFMWLYRRINGPDPGPRYPIDPVDVLLDPAALNGEQLFELTVAVVESRPDGLVGGEFHNAAGVASVRTALPPLHSQNGQKDGPYNLQEFATLFEAALQQPNWRLKVATGIDRGRANRAGAGSPLWAVRLGQAPGQALGFHVRSEQGPLVYAPRPIANVLRSGDVLVTGYVTGSGLTGPQVSYSFAGIDLDLWARQLLTAVDNLLAPAYVSAIGLIDSCRPPAEPKSHMQALLDAKQALTGAMASLVMPVLPNPPPDPTGAYQAAAREAFRQQLLVQLANAYTTDAIVQFVADVYSQATDPAAAPQLFGQLSQSGAVTQPISLSDPKLALVQTTAASGGQAQAGPVPFTFLLSSQQGQTDLSQSMRTIELTLSYKGSNIEHQIGGVTGIQDYKASSWLSFVRSEEPGPLMQPLGTFQVPLVLRSFPTPPTMRSQCGNQSVPDGTANLTLGQTVLWDYAFVYSEDFHYQQDHTYITVQFNYTPARLLAMAAASDPFPALAQFITVYPQVQADLEQYVAQLDPSKLDPSSDAYKDAGAALTAFANMAQQVAAALAGSTASHGRNLDALPAERYTFHVAEDQAQYGKPPAPAFFLSLVNLPPQLSGLQVQLDGWHTQPYTWQGTSGFVFLDDKGIALRPAAGEKLGPRQLKLPQLNLLARQDGWASAHIVRNEGAAQAFQYTTAEVQFDNPQYPTATFTNPAIEMAAIGAPGGKPVSRRLDQHLQALFQALFATAPEGEQTLQLECRYQYQVNPNLELVTLPVWMLPATAADPRVDLVIPSGGCPSADYGQGGTLLCRLAGATHRWLDSTTPNQTGAALTFDLTVMSNLAQQPLIQLRNLQLTLAYITDL